MNKSVGMLIMAVLCGLGAMYGTSRLIAKDKGPVVEKQDVLVAVRDFKVEEVVKPELVKVVRMDKSAVPAGAFSSVKDVEERWVQFAILENEPLIDRKLAPKGSPPGLSTRIPKGMRAFSVEVNEQTGVAGFIFPDHRVDVIQVDPGTSEKKPQAEAVLQDVLVLAAAQTFTRPDDRSIQARTVTLAVTPEQVDILVAAKQRGALSLAMRGVNDHEHIVLKKPEPVKEPVKAPEPEKPAPPPVKVVVEPPPPPPPQFRVVMLYRGPPPASGPRAPDRIHIKTGHDDVAVTDPFAGTMIPDGVEPIEPRDTDPK